MQTVITVVLLVILGSITPVTHASYIVVYHPNITRTTEFRQLLDSQRIGDYTSIGEFHWSSSETLPSNDTAASAVKYWIEDVPITIQWPSLDVQDNVPNWGLDRIDQRSGTDGVYHFPQLETQQHANVTIYLLDTGVNIQHPDLQGRASYGLTVVTDSPSDVKGHGTALAGICCGATYGVDKSARVVSVKTLDDEGNGRLSNLLQGLSWVVQQHLAGMNHTRSIVNLSLGAPYNQAANDAIEQALALGIHFAISAGNEGGDACDYSPGSVGHAITVGATEENDTIPTWSNKGECVDIYAPGSNIMSLSADLSESTRLVSGTSMASPFVAGVMSLYLSQKEYTPQELSDQLKNMSTQLSASITPTTDPLDDAAAAGQGVPADASVASANTNVFHLLYSLTDAEVLAAATSGASVFGKVLSATVPLATLFLVMVSS